MDEETILEKLSPTSINLKIKHYKYFEETKTPMGRTIRDLLDEHIDNENHSQ